MARTTKEAWCFIQYAWLQGRARIGHMLLGAITASNKLVVFENIVIFFLIIIIITLLPVAR